MTNNVHKDAEGKPCISIPKNTFYLICGFLLVIALLIFLGFEKLARSQPPIIVEPPTGKNTQIIPDGRSLPINEELGKVLNELNIAAAILIDNKARIQVMAGNGDKVDACGFVDGTKVKGCTKEKAKELNRNFVSISVVKGSPACVKIGVGPYSYKVHATNNPGRWRKGDFPCHNSQHS